MRGPVQCVSQWCQSGLQVIRRHTGRQSKASDVVSAAGVEECFFGIKTMTDEQLIKLECIARVQAITVAISARVEGMRAKNAERLSNGHAVAYDDEAFSDVESELMSVLRCQIGLT
jgi:hypothetical protein